MPRPPSSPLFPYTTLFRSQWASKVFPETSPEESTSAAGCRTALSAEETNTSVLSFSPRSSTTATRHSVSIWAAGERDSVVFIVKNQYERGEGNRASGALWQSKKCNTHPNLVEHA